MTRTGTSHFVSYEAAVAYYRPYHYTDVINAVNQKLDEGNIHIGPPILKPGQKLRVILYEQRYEIVENETPMETES